MRPRTLLLCIILLATLFSILIFVFQFHILTVFHYQSSTSGTSSTNTIHTRSTRFRTTSQTGLLQELQKLDALLHGALTESIHHNISAFPLLHTLFLASSSLAAISNSATIIDTTGSSSSTSTSRASTITSTGTNTKASTKSSTKSSTINTPNIVTNRLSVWDIPQTENYVDWYHPTQPVPWKHPLTDIGTPPRNHHSPVRGLHEISRAEAKNVVDAVASRVGLNPTDMSVLRLSRRVDRLYGVTYNTMVSGVQLPSNKTVIATFHLERRFSPLVVVNSRNLVQDSPILWIVVATSNHTPQLRAMIASLENMVSHQFVGLVVVDMTSTDDNVRRVVKECALLHTQYLLAPKYTFRFSRSMLLDYGIRSLNDDDVFFTSDVDMSLPRNLYTLVLASVTKGKQVYAPVVQSETERKIKVQQQNKQRHKAFPWGFGMFGAYVSDYIRIGGYNVHTFRYGWGGEDIELMSKFVRRGYGVSRPEEPNLLHRWHSKNSWDGRGTDRGNVGSNQKGKNTGNRRGMWYNGSKKEIQCTFSWRRGDVCKSIYDSIDIHFDRIWSLKITNTCEMKNKNNNHGNFVLDIDLPSGNYSMGVVVTEDLLQQQQHRMAVLTMTGTADLEVASGEMGLFEVKEVEYAKTIEVHSRLLQQVDDDTSTESDDECNGDLTTVVLHQLESEFSTISVASPHHCDMPSVFHGPAHPMLQSGTYFISVEETVGKNIRVLCEVVAVAVAVAVAPHVAPPSQTSRQSSLSFYQKIDAMELVVKSSSILYCRVDPNICEAGLMGIMELNVERIEE